jgi:hypothetical protein
MRDAPKRDHEVTPETADPSLERDPDGIKPIIDFRPEAVKDLPGKPGTNQSTRLALTGKQYQYLFGDDAEAAKELASKVRSKRRAASRSGWEDPVGAGELHPRGAARQPDRAQHPGRPFAAFIARMHRNIHELWGFGFLEDLDRKGMTDPSTT